MEKPTHIIFRIEDEELTEDNSPDQPVAMNGDKALAFVELKIDEEGNIEPEGRKFFVQEGDTYSQLNHGQIVFVVKADDSWSRVLISITVDDDTLGDVATISELNYFDLNAIVGQVLEEQFNQVMH